MQKALLGLLGLFTLTYAAIDINHATAKELTTIKGIGDKKAETIIAYRTQHGCFESVDAIVNVKGIGQKTFEKIKAELEVTACED